MEIREYNVSSWLTRTNTGNWLWPSTAIGVVLDIIGKEV